MHSKWPSVKLKDYCLKIGSGATPRGGSKVYLEAGEFTLIRSQNIYNTGFNKDGLVYITNEAAEKLKGVEVLPGDILLNITGDSVARICIAPEEYLPARVNQHVAIIRPVPNEFDSNYLRYFMSTPYMQDELLSIASSGGTRNALTKGDIESLNVPKPEINTQRKIAHYLLAFDKKITLNKHINQTLEAIAQATFKSWFIDFDPIKAKMSVLDAGGDEEQANLAAMRVISSKSQGELEALKVAKPTQYIELYETAKLFPSDIEDSVLGEIPNGWSFAEIGKITEVGIGKTPPRNEPHWFSNTNKDWRWVSIRDMADEGLYQQKSSEFLTNDAVIKHNVRIIPNNTVILSFKLTLGRVAITSGELLTNEAIAHFKLKKESCLTSEYIYLYLKQFDYNSLSSTSSIATAVNSKIVRSMPITVADHQIMMRFQRLVLPLFTKILSNQKQINTLAELRDTLLPRLLSGAIELPIDEECELDGVANG